MAASKFLSKPRAFPTPIITRNASRLSDAVKEAQRVIGYSTSFLNLRWLLTDEIANVALQIRKLGNTDHQFLRTARRLFFMDTHSPDWGLIILLISKAAGFTHCNEESDKDRVAGVLNSQRAISEVTEMMRMSRLMHNSIDVQSNNDAANFCNKLALLSGDFLLAKSSRELARLRNSDVTFLMSSTIRDVVESEFLSSKPYKSRTTKCVNIKKFLQSDTFNYDLALGNPRTEWICRTILSEASLLAKACKCTLKLGNHPERIQQLGYLIGVNVALAWRARTEREDFPRTKRDPDFSLVSAPVMLHLEKDASLFDLLEGSNLDYDELRNCILAGDGLNATKVLQNDFCLNALEALSELQKSDARFALENLIRASCLSHD